MVALNFMKAFDKIHHTTLVSKLETVAVPPLLIEWITCFLSERDHANEDNMII